ncbi:hypothetical protein [Shewanella sp. ENK2]|uniref:hypothetical protein n=1 Tax=Shewanella sp. ENK2 TaxID=2775245 RepID=UPI00374A47E4
MIISWLLLFANINSTQASTVFEQAPKQAESKSETASDSTVEAVQKLNQTLQKPTVSKALLKTLHAIAAHNQNYR